MRPPQVVWLELTSKCPFDCTFCSRRNLRGEGNHMPIGMVAQICSELTGTEVIRLNYSGESVNHPEFDRALQFAKQTGAQTELVTALASIPATHLRALVDHGLDRVSVSLHTLDSGQFQQIYRFSSLDQLRTKIAALQDYKRERNSHKPVLDFSIVAMRDNLNQLEGIAAYAKELGVPAITIHPVIQRDPADADVSWETAGPRQLNEDFARKLRDTIDVVGVAHPELMLSASRPLTPIEKVADGAPFTCDQNPFETTHILSDGRVVPCEVLDCQPLGNLNRNSFGQIWNGESYRQFRSDYLANKVSACKTCEYRKTTAQAGPLLPIYGWHERDPSGTLWSRRVSEAQLQVSGAGLLRIDGILPPAFEGANHLEVGNSSSIVGRIYNRTGENQPFSVELPVRVAADHSKLSFTVLQPYQNEVDMRELGFALTGAHWTAAPGVVPAGSVSRRRRYAVGALMRILSIADRKPLPPIAAPRWNGAHGVSVLIPARGPVDVLLPCLESLRQALKVDEPHEVIVIVNGSDAAEYDLAHRLFPEVKFRFQREALGFSKAIQAGLQHVRYAWTYLLNSDMTVQPATLSSLMEHRKPTVFGLGSRIRLADGCNLETGFTRLRLQFERAELQDLEPCGDRQNLYCGGGSSLFQTALLRKLSSSTACYDPFYWEDVEWGVTARSWGFESLFIGESEVVHQRRSTVNRFYKPAEVERIFERNRIQFELRCLPSLVSLDALTYCLEHAPRETACELLRPMRSLPLLCKRRLILGAAHEALPDAVRTSPVG